MNVHFLCVSEDKTSKKIPSIDLSVATAEVRAGALSWWKSKIGGHDSFHTRSKQNYESDSAEILTVAVYDNLLHDSKFLLR